MKFVDISGFGHSGKTAVSDYLKQFDTVFGFPNYMEFELLRVPGGLLDLYFSLYESWNLIRSTIRINDFIKLVKRIGTIQTGSKPITYFTTSGHGYNQYFNNRFIELSEQLIKNIIIAEQRTFWPYENLRLPPLSVFYNKFKAKFFNSLTSAVIYYSDRNTFIKHVNDYMQQLFQEAATEKHTHVILSNAFEPFNPSLSIKMAGDACAIIVERDPRDVYASQIKNAEIFVPDFENAKHIDTIKKQITGFDDIKQFVFRFKALRNNIHSEDESKVLRIRYEDFLTDHDNEAKKVVSFIELPSHSKIINAQFDLSKSIKNVGLWKNYQHLDEIKFIQQELGEYCYQR